MCSDGANVIMSAGGGQGDGGRAGGGEEDGVGGGARPISRLCYLSNVM